MCKRNDKITVKSREVHEILPDAVFTLAEIESNPEVSDADPLYVLIMTPQDYKELIAALGG